MLFGTQVWCCDQFPKSIKVSNELPWTLIPREKKPPSPLSLSATMIFMATLPQCYEFLPVVFQAEESTFLEAKTHAVTQHPGASILQFPKKDHFKQQLNSGPTWLQNCFYWKNPPEVFLSGSVREAEGFLLEELSAKQIKTNVCDKQQPFVKSAHSKDHIFSLTRLQFLFALSHHCTETW